VEYAASKGPGILSADRAAESGESELGREFRLGVARSLALSGSLPLAVTGTVAHWPIQPRTRCIQPHHRHAVMTGRIAKRDTGRGHRHLGVPPWSTQISVLWAW
jgi:hypothetical protein